MNQPDHHRVRGAGHEQLASHGLDAARALMPNSSAASETVRPPKNRSSSIFALMVVIGIVNVVLVIFSERIFGQPWLVAATAAGHRVRAGSAVENIPILKTSKAVISGTSEHTVGAGSPFQRVVAAGQVDHGAVQRRRQGQHLIRGAADD